MAQQQGNQHSAVVVTGGASGIGLACAQVLAESGHPVAIWDINEEKSEAEAQAITQATGIEAIGLGVNVADLEQLDSGIKATRARLGTVSGLVHAAGIAGVSPLEQLTEEFWSAVMDINLRSWPFIIKGILEDLKASPGAAVVCISSINATLGNAMNPAYSASKAGLLGISRALADDLAQHGIRINTVSPGQILTPMIQNAINASPGLQESFEARIMMARLGEPREVANAVKFLLSSDASYITGAELVVDGGNIPSQRR